MTGSDGTIHDSNLRSAWPRLLAEFFVIVTGVLVVSGVDSWVSWTQDRALDTDGATRLLNRQAWRIDGTLDITGILGGAAEELRATILRELSAAGGSL